MKFEDLVHGENNAVDRYIPIIASHTALRQITLWPGVKAFGDGGGSSDVTAHLSWHSICFDGSFLVCVDPGQDRSIQTTSQPHKQRAVDDENETLVVSKKH